MFADVTSEWTLNHAREYVFRSHVVLPGFLGIPRYYLSTSAPVPSEYLREHTNEAIERLCHTHVATTLEALADKIESDEQRPWLTALCDLRRWVWSQTLAFRWRQWPRLKRLLRGQR